MSTPALTLPWYRHPWPWLLMLAPATALVVGFYSLWLSIVTADPLVSTDYYREGAAINQDLRQEAVSRRLGLQARVYRSAGQLVVALQAAQPFQAPPQLAVRLVHSTRGGLDQSLLLSRQPDGQYSGTPAALAPGRWTVLLLDPEGSWRLDQTLSVRP